MVREAMAPFKPHQQDGARIWSGLLTAVRQSDASSALANRRLEGRSSLGRGRRAALQHSTREPVAIA